MRICSLGDLAQGSVVQADLVIVGGGPVGLTIARACARKGRRILVLESGDLEENDEHELLNAVESAGAQTPEQIAKRRSQHGVNAKFWSHENQPFGVRCRALGGSTNAWAGKSAAFSPIDFEKRDWLDLPGWPISYAQMLPYIDRAIQALELCPVDPKTRFSRAQLHSFYWQFARSRINHIDAMRFGQEIQRDTNLEIEIVLDATVTRINLDASGNHFQSLNVASTRGQSITVQAGICVLAASCIENARLLLASDDIAPNGIGNRYDQVGRNLIDHIGCEIAKANKTNFNKIWRDFGFTTVGHGKKSHLFMHGLVLSPEVQKQEKLTHAAIYFLPRLAQDDPWRALKRLLARKSKNTFSDVSTIVRGVKYIVIGAAQQIMVRPSFPAALRNFIVNLVIRLSPNFVAEEFLSQGLPRKINGVSAEAISEQLPHPDSRISLSDQRDRFGVRLALVNWRIHPVEISSVIRLAKLVQQNLADAGYGDLELADWIAEDAPERAVIVDMGHTLGATRMSATPEQGVVDTECQVHGVSGLYVAGGSVFPTSGHANPTLMMLALAARLSDHINLQLSAEN